MNIFPQHYYNEKETYGDQKILTKDRIDDLMRGLVQEVDLADLVALKIEEFERQMEKVIAEGKEKCKHLKRFFIHDSCGITSMPGNVLPKEYRVLQITNMCPYPAFNSRVYEYDNTSDTLREIWALPRFEYYEELMARRNDVEEHEKDYLKYCIAHENGELNTLMLKINGFDKGIESGIIGVEKGTHGTSPK